MAIFKPEEFAIRKANVISSWNIKFMGNYNLRHLGVRKHLHHEERDLDVLVFTNGLIVAVHIIDNSESREHGFPSQDQLVWMDFGDLPQIPTKEIKKMLDAGKRTTEIFNLDCSTTPATVDAVLEEIKSYADWDAKEATA